MTGRNPPSRKVGLRFRHFVEGGLLLFVGYLAVHIGPAVSTRVQFLNELEVAANSPVHETASDIKLKILRVADSSGVTILADDLHVRRNVAQSRTYIEARYQVHISFWPSMVYVWHIEDNVEAFLF